MKDSNPLKLYARIELNRCEMLRQVGLNRIVIGQIIQLFIFRPTWADFGLISASLHDRSPMNRCDMLEETVVRLHVKFHPNRTKTKVFIQIFFIFRPTWPDFGLIA